MSAVTQHPVRTQEGSVPRIDLMRIRGTYLITTSDNAQRRVTIDHSTPEKSEKLASSQARVLVSYAPWGDEFQTEMQPMIVHSIVALGRPWNLGTEDPQDVVVTSIVPTTHVNA